MTKRPRPIAAGARVDKLRIALVGHLLGDMVFGAERSLLELLAALDPGEHEAVCVFPCASSDYLRTVAKYTKRIHVFPYAWWHGTRRVDPPSVARFERIFRRERVDLVHVNTITLMDPLVAARRLGIPGVTHVRELISHDPDLAAVLGEAPDTIVGMIQDASDFVIGNSDATCRLFGQSGTGFRLYNSVDVDRFDLPIALEPGRLRVGLISSKRPKKGVEAFVRIAIAASRSRPDLEFLVVGPHNEHTEGLAGDIRQEPGPVHVLFVGYVADPVEALRQLDVVVSFSDVVESFGRTITEAMAARRPVVAWDRGAASELVRHAKDGFLVPYLDVAAAVRCLERLADDPGLVRKMGRDGRERATRVFSRAATAPQLKEIYRRVVAAWKGGRREAPSPATG